MSPVDIIRAWKDKEYRRSLTDAQRAALPEHPAGLITLDDEELAKVAGLGGGHVTRVGFTCIIQCP
jgi:mersacidin/lichenicidin family type 2 lantibiotic